METIFTKNETIALRNKHVDKCVELFFKNEPLKIVKGKGI